MMPGLGRSFRPLWLCRSPSINHYWRRAGRFIHISREGRAYREKVAELLAAEHVEPLFDRLAV